MALAVVLVLPTVAWMVANPEDVTRRVEKFALGEGGGVVGSLMLGVADFASAVVAFLAALVAAYLAASFRTGRSPAIVREPAFSLIKASLVVGLLLVLVTVVASGATNVKDRWLQPVLFYAPLVLAGVLANRLPPVRLKALAAGAALAALVVMVALPIRILTAGGGDRTMVENRPFADFAQRIREEVGFRDGTIIASDYATGGNLALQFPAASTLIPEYERLSVPTPWPVLLVWSGDDKAPPAALAATLGLRFKEAQAIGAAVTLTAPAHYGRGAVDRLNVLKLDQPG